MTHAARRGLIATAFVLSFLSAASWALRLVNTGLALEVREDSGARIASYPRTALNMSRIDALLLRGNRAVRAEWTGYWNVPAPGFAELVLKSEGEARVVLDGEEVLGIGADEARGHRIARQVSPGLHRLNVVYSTRSKTRREVFLKGITAAGRSVPLERSLTFPSEPRALDLAMGWAARVLPWFALLAWGLVVALLIRDRARFDLGRKMPALLLGVVVLVAGAFRFEAMVFRYWGAEGPDWADALATEIRDHRPGAFEHVPNPEAYGGDPFSYLTIARSTGGFYEPSGREPLFPALTRLALGFASGRDIGINFLSALSSTLVCVAIFFLGLRLVSPWTGLFAALLWAIEWQAIGFSVEGWRDDLFTLEVASCAAALSSLHLSPSTRGAILLGIVGGLTLLTRLSALTFLVPGLIAAIVLKSPALRRDRLRAAGIAASLMLALAGPFMLSCALGYGDPFYAVNVHAAFYRGRAGLPGRGSSTALQFLAQSLLPWEFLRTGFVGLTSYPFLNKWSGLGAFLPLGEIARTLALAGLPVLLWRPGGLIALIVLVFSILPYAWTWTLPGGSEWRFTLPAYPFYLVSAVAAVECTIRGLREMMTPSARRPVLRSALRYTLTALALMIFGMWLSQWINWQRVKEEVQNGRPALIEPGTEARPFFTQGWEGSAGTQTPATVTMNAPEARLRLPVPEGLRARVVLRLAPPEDPSASVSVLVGEERVLILSSPQDQRELVNLDLTPENPRTGGVVEIRFINPKGIARPSPLTLLWVRIDSLTAPGS
jgi:hypothetical protein